MPLWTTKLRGKHKLPTRCRVHGPARSLREDRVALALKNGKRPAFMEKYVNPRHLRKLV